MTVTLGWVSLPTLKKGHSHAAIDSIYDKLLLILSEHSIESDWVEFEVETALAKERKEKRTVLFPICLDNTVMESTTAWAAHIKNTRHIGDFTCWKNHDDYRKAFDRLLRDLKTEPPSCL